MFSSTRSCDTRARRTRETVVRRRASSPNTRTARRRARRRTRRSKSSHHTTRPRPNSHLARDRWRQRTDRSRARPLAREMSRRRRRRRASSAPRTSPRRAAASENHRTRDDDERPGQTSHHARTHTLDARSRSLSRVALFGASRTRVPTLANAKRDPRERETRVPIINHAPPSRVESTNASIHSFIHSFITHTHTHAHTRAHTHEITHPSPRLLVHVRQPQDGNHQPDLIGKIHPRRQFRHHPHE